MLANLLPGVRALRGPLTAGSLWLLFTWLALDLHDERPDGPAGEIVSLARESPDPVVFGALALLAYVVGSVSEDVLSRLQLRCMRQLRANAPLVLPPRVESAWTTPPVAEKLVQPRDAHAHEAAAISAEVARLGDTIDRLQAEIGFRLAVVPPLAALAILFAVDQRWPWIFVLVAVPLLLWQAHVQAVEVKTAVEERNKLLA